MDRKGPKKRSEKGRVSVKHLVALEVQVTLSDWYPQAIDDSLASDVDLTTVRRLLVGLQVYVSITDCKCESCVLCIILRG
jgi:hypothetical protein